MTTRILMAVICFNGDITGKIGWWDYRLTFKAASGRRMKTTYMRDAFPLRLPRLAPRVRLSSVFNRRW
jgi:hypothetical protein